MFSYYGAKTNIVHLYPAPKYRCIIEPFAGTAKYSLLHFDNEVTLIDKYEGLINIWKWLQLCSEGDILKLPRHIKPGQRVDDFNFDCSEARDFFGYLIGYAQFSPRRTASKTKLSTRPNHVNHGLKRVAGDLHKIRHWNIKLGSFEELQNERATWFIDPPYQEGGHKYVCNNKNLDYAALAGWCLQREGQVIVCEKEKARWLDFKALATQQGAKGAQQEGVWSNLALRENTQLTMF